MYEGNLGPRCCLMLCIRVTWGTSILFDVAYEDNLGPRCCPMLCNGSRVLVESTKLGRYGTGIVSV